MKRLLFFSVTAMVFSQLAFAAKGGGVYMGGVGFLFPDSNEFTNPGQMAQTSGTAFQADYTRMEPEGMETQQTLTSSLVMGNGKWGGGAFVSRAGAVLNSSSQTDRAGVGLGFGFSKFTIGGAYERQLSSGQADDGTASMSFNFNEKGRMGFAMGAKATTTINQVGEQTRTAIAGIGYGFQQNTNIEGFYAFNDLNDTSNYSWGGAATFGIKSMYISGGYTNTTNTIVSSLGMASARLGFVIGMVDFSAQAAKILEEDMPWIYGGTLRASF